MSGNGNKNRTGRKSGDNPLSREDWALWEKVKQTAKPMHKSRPDAALATPAAPSTPAPSTPAPGSRPEPQNKTLKAAPVGQKPRTAVNPHKPPQVRPSAPTLNPLDRRTVQRISRGATDIDGRIDLHGMTQRNAHAQLWRFLTASQARGHKVVLVITGKGTSKTSDFGDFREIGILRRAVPLWLQEPGFRALVVGYEQARRHHGGDGALYIRLRRRTVDGPR